MASLAAQGPPPSTKALAQFATEYDRSHRALQLQRGGAAGAGAGAPPTDPALERSAREHRRKEAEGIQKELGTLEYQAQELDVALQAVTKQNAEEQGRLRQTKDALARLNANKSQMQKDFQAHCRHVRGQEEGFRKALAGQQQAGKGQQQQQQQQQEQPGQPQQQQPGQGQGGQQQGGEQQQQGGPAAAAADPAFDQKRMEEHVRQLNAQIKSMATEQHQLTEFCDRMHELGNSFKPLGRQLAASMGLPPFECFAKEEEPKQQPPQEGQQEAAAGAADDAAAPAPAEGAAGGGQEGAATTTA